MQDKTKILLVEDDVNLGSLLKQYLVAKNYDTELYTDGEAGYEAFMNNRYNACILDIMLPKKDGLSLAEDIRQVNSQIPVIFLTAKSMKNDIFEGFKTGADDYITKPFDMQELLFRLEAILRRSGNQKEKKEPATYRLGKYTFNPTRQLLTDSEKEIKLTTKESELLRLLCNNKNEVLERQIALKNIWLDDNYFNARSMDVYITKLRKHLKDEPAVKIINVHSKGYKLIES